MSAIEATAGTLATTESHPRSLPYIERPGWYDEYDGNVVIRTPHATDVVYKNGPGKFPWSRKFPARHYFGSSSGFIKKRNPEFAPDKIGFKRFGEDIEVYRVEGVGGESP